MKIGRISKPVVISTTHQPISAMLSVEQEGAAPLTQSVDQVTRTWEPDRRISPLILNPVFSAVDPETGDTLSLTPVFAWYLVDYTAVSETMTLITASYDPSVNREYSVDTDSKLVVRKNVSPNTPITIMLRATYTDPNNGKVYNEEQYILLSSANKPDETYSVDVLTEPVVRFNPLDANMSDVATTTDAIYEFEAVIRHGGEIYTGNDIVCVWEIDDVKPQPQTWDMNVYNTPGYIIGQFRRTLRMDARFCKNTKITVRISPAGAGGLPSTDPDTGQIIYYPCLCTRTLMWDVPRIKGDVLPLNGRAIRSEDTEKGFRLMLRTPSNDISSSVVNSHFMTKWVQEDTNSLNQGVAGYGSEITMSASSLRRTGNTSVLIMPEVQIISPMAALYVGDNDVIVVDDTVGTQNAVVVADCEFED